MPLNLNVRPGRLQVLGLASLFFVVTGIQFWVTAYMVVVLGRTQAEVTPAFGVVSITAPILGVISGGR